jgi:amino-acid N-acetyltransferase
MILHQRSWSKLVPATSSHRPVLTVSKSKCLDPRPCVSSISSTSRLRGAAAPVKQGSTHPRRGIVEQRPPIGQLAKQKEEDKQFFADLLSSAATRRDASAYIKRLKSSTRDPEHKHKVLRHSPSTPSIFGRSTAVEKSPVFQQGQDVSKSTEPIEDHEIPHVALVKLSGLSTLDHGTLHGIAGTLVQLARLSMLPCVVVDEPRRGDLKDFRNIINQQAERLVSAIDEISDQGARKVTDILTFGADGRASVSLLDLLLRPLSQGRIPVIVPIAYDEETLRTTAITADDAILAVTRTLSGAHPRQAQTTPQSAAVTRLSSVDRIIVISPSGGIPSPKALDEMHVFVNLEQEYHTLQEELRSSTDPKVASDHASNLAMLRRALQMLPAGASGLITTPIEAANSSRRASSDSVSSVRTRSQRNPLIHNLLTDKPAYSSSLPSSRLSTRSPSLTASTFVKRGMPLTILPNPAAQEWIPTKRPWIKLTDPRIDLDRLVHLINDSFDRTLDVEAYLSRVNNNIAGVIIAGAYEGGAILTWEQVPPSPSNPTNTNPRLVPYLDKFAVLKKSQGAGGVADILFNAMVRTCFPNGVCWRSRKDNPVNKWYFERSRGTWKIPDMNWTIFWTTPDVVPGAGDGDDSSSNRTFLDYEAVCRGIQPTWRDGKKIED